MAVYGEDGVCMCVCLVGKERTHARRAANALRRGSCPTPLVPWNKCTLMCRTSTNTKPQAQTTACHERAYLGGLDFWLIRGTCDQEGVAAFAQLFLKRLQTARKNSIFHRRNDCTNGKCAFRCHDPCAEIWSVSQIFDRLHDPRPGISNHLLRRIQTP